MRYVQRGKDGVVLGHFANEQTYARELVADDHPDILAWNEARKPKPVNPADSLESKFAALSARIDAMEARLAANPEGSAQT